jgi:hypothetical protein
MGLSRKSSQRFGATAARLAALAMVATVFQTVVAVPTASAVVT